jgi:hypothetical protein
MAHQTRIDKHLSTRALFDYGNRQRGERPAPARSDIDPAAIRHALGDTFMLATDFIDEIRLRLAGTRVCAFLGGRSKAQVSTRFGAKRAAHRLQTW